MKVKQIVLLQHFLQTSIKSIKDIRILVSCIQSINNDFIQADNKNISKERQILKIITKVMIRESQFNYITYINGHYNSSVRIKKQFFTPLILCLLILNMSGGTYSLKTTPNDRFLRKLCIAIIFTYSQRFCQIFFAYFRFDV